MDKRVDSIKKTATDKGQILFALDGSCAVSQIIISGKKALPELKLEYAQNGVVTDLLPLRTVPAVSQTEISIELERPVFATHIFVTSVNRIDIAEIDLVLFEEGLESFEAYPQCIDKKLPQNYCIDSIFVSSRGTGCFDFSLYKSMDGVNFDYLSSYRSCRAGEIITIPADETEARFVRVFLEYCSDYDNFSIDRITIAGVASDSPIMEAPSIEVPDFEDSSYNVDITEEDTFREIYGIIERTVGKAYRQWFTLELCKNPKSGHAFDFYELSDDQGKVHIKGNNGVSIAAGLNHYFKYYCKVNISQVGNQTRMPEHIVPIQGAVLRETKTKIRYAYNYCTLSYTMAFWGEKEWRKELDWLALNGVNLVLDITAQEEVWRRFLSRIGYSLEDIKGFLTGPAYYAWLYMANTTGLGGPVHDTWFAERTELARKNHLIMRKLGMYPILQGYSGMMPINIRKYDPDVDILDQGTWGASIRPPMLRTTSKSYERYAESFYQCQREVYGGYSFYYATDPFHEGGRTGDMKPREISYRVLSAMLKENKNAVWILQSWQGNPSSELLKGISDVENGKDHAMVLDLYAEKDPNYPKGGEGHCEYGYGAEFDSTPWIFCMLNNFGGRLGLHGHLDRLQRNVPVVLNDTKYNVGIGITPEASENNPILYDFFFESIWQKDAQEPLEPIELDSWLEEYALRRYGARSDAAIRSLKILVDTVYKAECNMRGQGAPECILNARPSLEITAASTWGNSIIGYDPEKLKEALALMKQDFDLLQFSEGYRYDFTTLTLQVLANEMLSHHKLLREYFEKKDIGGFKRQCSEILLLAEQMETEAARNEHYCLAVLVQRAEALGQNADAFSRNLYRLNAKAQITTWGEFKRSELGLLHDYSNRPWSGLIQEVYIPRWERWMRARLLELQGKPFEDDMDWFAFEWHWVIGHN